VTTSSSSDRTVQIKLEVVAVPWDDLDAVGLRAAQEAEMELRYADADRPADLEDAAVAVAVDPTSVAVNLLARADDGTPVGCVAVRDVSGIDDVRGRGTVHPAATGEVKRLYVAPSHRGQGVARLLMAEAERQARAAGFRLLVLETGTMQPEAMALYPSLGYEPIEGFGDHVWSDLQRCFAKRLDQPAT
jgi:GNAT superfamily N-acetyltransferase